VKFLIDNQLPAALAQYLRDRGCDCQHVREAGPGDALDTKYAGTPKIKVTSLSARMKIFSTSPNGPARKSTSFGSAWGTAGLRHYWRLSTDLGRGLSPL